MCSLYRQIDNGKYEIQENWPWKSEFHSNRADNDIALGSFKRANGLDPNFARAIACENFADGLLRSEQVQSPRVGFPILKAIRYL